MLLKIWILYDKPNNKFILRILTLPINVHQSTVSKAPSRPFRLLEWVATVTGLEQNMIGFFTTQLCCSLKNWIFHILIALIFHSIRGISIIETCYITKYKSVVVECPTLKFHRYCKTLDNISCFNLVSSKTIFAACLPWCSNCQQFTTATFHCKLDTGILACLNKDN